jgi:cytochrome b561
MTAAPIARYGAVAIAVHWLMAVLIAIQAGMGLAMTRMAIGPEQFQWYARHKSLGIVLLTLLGFRLAWRWSHPPPPIPLPDRERRAARAVHIALYVIMAAVPLTGWAMASASNAPVSVFGLVTLPDLVAPDRAARAFFLTAHVSAAVSLAVLVTLHVAAALRHVVRGDGIAARMWLTSTGRGSTGRGT